MIAEELVGIWILLMGLVIWIELSGVSEDSDDE